MTKFNLILSGCLTVSIILNGVLFYNLATQEREIQSKFQEQYKDEINKKNKIITALKTENINLKNSENDKEKNSELEAQRKFKSVANQFVKFYLEYSNKQLSERRNNLLSLSSKDVVDKIAPEVNEESDNKVLSSDPVFTSKLKESNIFVSETNNITNSVNAIAVVTYFAKGSEGETEIRAFIYMNLKKESDNSIKVTDFEYYPM
ncbi:hypothetical protein NSQ61_19795 [Aeribacillus sp. FSL K6-1121]|uniref:hypothetical protein n=1 Tax=Aeribacillus sp. FSL K6-1121 TaxID=2954745 RepID=UPI0030FCCCA1